MPCYTHVRTTITDLALAIESPRKVGWKGEKSLRRLGQDISAAFRTPAGTLRLSPATDGTYQAQGVPRGTVTDLVRSQDHLSETPGRRGDVFTGRRHDLR